MGKRLHNILKLSSNDSIVTKDNFKFHATINEERGKEVSVYFFQMNGSFYMASTEAMKQYRKVGIKLPTPSFRIRFNNRINSDLESLFDSKVKPRLKGLDLLNLVNVTRNMGEFSPKETEEVLEALAKTSDESHGGDNASGEVEDSPNEMDNGKIDKKTSSSKGVDGKDNLVDKGGKPVGKAEPPKDLVKKISEMGSTNNMWNPIRSLDKVFPESETVKKLWEKYESLKEEESKDLFKIVKDKEIKAGGEGSTAYLYSDSREVRSKRGVEDLCKVVASWIGKSNKSKGEPAFDLDLYLDLKSREMSVLPAIEGELEQEYVARVLITVDTSGSTSSWSATGIKVADRLAKLGKGTFESYRLDNFNGSFYEYNGKVDRKVVADYDFVIYLGDTDCFRTYTKFASEFPDKKFLILSNVYSNDIKPRKSNLLGEFKNVLSIEGVKVDEDMSDLTDVARLIKKYQF